MFPKIWGLPKSSKIIKVVDCSDILVPSGKLLHFAMERSTMLFSWENPRFRLGHGFQFANCQRFPEGILKAIGLGFDVLAIPQDEMEDVMGR